MLTLELIAYVSFHTNRLKLKWKQYIIWIFKHNVQIQNKQVCVFIKTSTIKNIEKLIQSGHYIAYLISVEVCWFQPMGWSIAVFWLWRWRSTWKSISWQQFIHRISICVLKNRTRKWMQGFQKLRKQNWKTEIQ